MLTRLQIAGEFYAPQHVSPSTSEVVDGFAVDPQVEIFVRAEPESNESDVAMVKWVKA